MLNCHYSHASVIQVHTADAFETRDKQRKGDPDIKDEKLLIRFIGYRCAYIVYRIDKM